MKMMEEKLEGEYTERCNELIAVVEEALRYSKEVQDSLADSKSKLDMINQMQQNESDPLYHSAMKELVTLLNKCISRVQEFQSEFSKRCDGAIAGASELAVACEGLVAEAQTTKRMTQASGVIFTTVGATALGLATAGIGNAAVGAAVGAMAAAAGGIVAQAWANDFEEVKKELIETKEKLTALRQTSYELQTIVDDSRRILEKLEPLIDTIDRLSTGDGEIHNCEGLQIAFQSLAKELERIHQECTLSSSP